MKIRHISGPLAEVDDEYGKRLVDSGEWKRVRRAPAKNKSSEDTDNEE